MEKLKKLFKKVFKVQFDKEDIDQMKPIDGVFALLYFLFSMGLIYCFGLLVFKADMSSNFSKSLYNHSYIFYKFILHIPFIIISVLPAFIIIYFRKQKLSSLGLRKDNILKSIILGTLFGLPWLIINVVIGITNNYTLYSIDILIWGFLFCLIINGFTEELVFRGFIQIRIRGLIKSKWLSIIIVGIMFWAVHVPILMLNANLTLIEFIKVGYLSIIFIPIMHIYLVFIYTKYNNIIAPIITHTIVNFSSYMFLYPGT